MTPELWTPRRRGAPRVECAPPFGFGLPFDMPPVILSGILILNPLAIPNCVAWYRADLGVTIATGVSAWADQSGSGDANKNVAQATGSKQPTRNTSDAAYNLKPTLSFASAALQNLASGAWAVAPPKPCTVFFVGNDDGSATNQAAIDDLASYGMLLETNEGAAVGFDIYAGAQLNSGVARSASPRVYGAIFNGATSQTFVSANTASATGAAGTAGATGITLGSTHNNASYWNGKLAEIAVYNRVISASEISQLNAYLGTRYAITIGA